MGIKKQHHNNQYPKISSTSVTPAFQIWHSRYLVGQTKIPLFPHHSQQVNFRVSETSFN